MKTQNGVNRPGSSVFAVLVGAVFLLAYWPTFASLWQSWMYTDGQSHGILVALISIYLLYADRKRIFAAPQPFFWAAIPLLGMSLLWLLAGLAGIQILQQLAIPVLALCAVAVMFGLYAAYASVFAVGYFYFAVPIWGALGPTLQQWTIDVVSWTVRATHVPAFIEGNSVTIPSGRFAIEAGCSGLHYFVVSFALAVLYGYLNFKSLGKRFVFTGLALLVALIANWVRVYTIILAGYLTEMKHFLVTVDHYYYGWVLFGVFLVPIFIVGHRLGIPESGPKSGAESGSESNKPRASYPEMLWSRKGAFAIGLTVAALVIGPLSYGAASKRAPNGLAGEVRLPAATGSWRGPIGRFIDWRPQYLNPTRSLGGSYQNGRTVVDLYLYIYADQHDGHELVYDLNEIADDRHWLKLGSTGREFLADSGAAAIAVNEVVLRNVSRGTRVVWYWYYIAGRETANRYVAKLYQATGVVTGLDDGILVAISAKCDSTCDTARNHIQQFLKDHYADTRTMMRSATMNN